MLTFSGRKKKVVTKERRKLKERMGQIAQTLNEQEDMELFAIKNIKNEKVFWSATLFHKLTY